jgi:hypothetical protein
MTQSPPGAPDLLRRVRTLLLALLALGLSGTGAELVAFEHFEDAWQAVPIGLIAVALAMVLWNAAAPPRGSVRLFQILMVAFLAAGVLGVYLHFQGNLEFQLEIDPDQSRWDLFNKVIHAKAPPSLAPGSMAQLGLLGLIWSYRHPALARSSAGHTQGA